MSQILIVVHQETSSPGLVGEKLQARGYDLDIRCPALGDALPETLAHHAAAIVFGGPMSANDDETLPFIQTELDWIPIALDSGKPYLGICLGAQLLARVLGATVSPHPQQQKEIGYFNLRATPVGRTYFPEQMGVYHWHKEGFTIPPGAVQLAEGDVFPNQAFCYGGTAFALQFHPEMTHRLIDEWTTRGADQLSGLGVQHRDLHFRYHGQFAGAVECWLDRFLDIWLATPPWHQHRSA